ncbi:MAG TPA: serine/threonine-protein kinase [Micromonosporaceae bacterium]
MLAGDVIADRYRLDDQVASGGMSDVWSATDILLKRRVAVKIILPALLAEPGFAQRFESEARIMAALRHPGIVTVYDYGETAGPGGEIAYLVMELVDGQPLSERLAVARRLAVDETMSIIAQAADALDAAHAAGVVHRDVKPGNLLLHPDGTVTLVDFGVATRAGALALTAPNEVPGTALYMAPEQVSKQDATPAVDVYALGVVAYECLAGVPPFTGPHALAVAMRHVHEEPPPLPADVPAPARELVERAMAKDPGQRFPDAGALAIAARAVVTPATDMIAVPFGVDANGEQLPTVRSAEPSTAVITGPPRRSGRRKAAVLAAAVAGLAAVLAAPASLENGAPPANGDAPATATPLQTNVTSSRSSGARLGSPPAGTTPTPGVSGASAAGSAAPIPSASVSGAPTTSASRPSPTSSGAAPGPPSPAPAATTEPAPAATTAPAPAATSAPAVAATSGPAVLSGTFALIGSLLQKSGG